MPASTTPTSSPSTASRKLLRQVLPRPTVTPNGRKAQGRLSGARPRAGGRPTLADRIAKGPIPLDEALPIAKQIAEALEAAHEAGVIHRDLKPANIKVREDRTVKVLDFGLAKALGPNPQGDPSQSPTLTVAATQMGVIIGTAAYMSPEQASGSTADKRADIWSFGVVLYEMLTGQRPFTGETVSHVLAGVLREEPAWGGLPDATPSPITRLLSRCLRQDRKYRLRDIGDALVELNDDLGREPVEAIRQSRSWARPALAFTAVGLLAFLFGWQMNDPVSTNAAESFIHRVSLDVSDAAPLAFDARASASGVDSTLLDISPDGRTIVFVGETDGESRLYVRRLDSFLTRPLQGTEGAVHPFFSPDGESVGFLSEDKVQAIRLAGGGASCTRRRGHAGHGDVVSRRHDLFRRPGKFRSVANSGDWRRGRGNHSVQGL